MITNTLKLMYISRLAVDALPFSVKCTPNFGNCTPPGNIENMEHFAYVLHTNYSSSHAFLIELLLAPPGATRIS